jgi:hypothetical protein
VTSPEVGFAQSISRIGARILWDNLRKGEGKCCYGSLCGPYSSDTTMRAESLDVNTPADRPEALHSDSGVLVRDIVVLASSSSPLVDDKTVRSRLTVISVVLSRSGV